VEEVVLEEEEAVVPGKTITSTWIYIASCKQRVSFLRCLTRTHHELFFVVFRSVLFSQERAQFD
jgi:hypothetical protein